MMSICLQSMVDELMVKKSGGSIKKVCVKKTGIVLHLIYFSFLWINKILTLYCLFIIILFVMFIFNT